MAEPVIGATYRLWPRPGSRLHVMLPKHLHGCRCVVVVAANPPLWVKLMWPLPSVTLAAEAEELAPDPPPENEHRVDEFEPWPCKTIPNALAPPRLVTALYLLLRDHVQPGDLEQVMLNVREVALPEFSNPHLAEYAEALAAYLMEPKPKKEHRERIGW